MAGKAFLTQRRLPLVRFSFGDFYSFISANLDYVNTYVRDLLDLLSLYQQHYPEPNAEIKSKAQEIDTDFLAEDLSNILSSMDAGAERIQTPVHRGQHLADPRGARGEFEDRFNEK